MIKKIMLILGLVAAIGTAVPLSIKASRWVAGTPALAARISVVEERLNNKIIQDRMDKLEERMWAMEDRWGEKYLAEHDKTHESVEELLQFMTKEAREHYRYLEKQYKELQKELEEEDE
ncbi:MAG: hypothetical protein DRP42_06210 [Tenericutes bacterium]|nr:MAG: hypothetical protein DRP42_06210 [Mycoplasmatota bacterium]